MSARRGPEFKRDLTRTAPTAPELRQVDSNDGPDAPDDATTSDGAFVGGMEVGEGES